MVWDVNKILFSQVFEQITWSVFEEAILVTSERGSVDQDRAG